jgi:uncharacterized protein
MKRILSMVISFAVTLFAQASFSQSSPPADVRAINPDTKFLALIIGNASYTRSSSLPGVDNDAKDIAQLFRAIGFTISNGSNILNLTRQDMAREIGAFLNKLDTKTVGVVYYSGHGLEDRGINYLVPVDAKVDSPADVYSQLISLNDALIQMERRGARTQIIILDACRNMPETLKTKNLGGAGGLREINSLGQGTKLVYAAAPGQKALPAGTNQRNSVFTAALLDAAREPVATFDDVLNRAGALTAERTNRNQLPWLSGTLGMSVNLRAKDLSSMTNAPISTSAATTVNQKQPVKKTCFMFNNEEYCD